MFKIDPSGATGGEPMDEADLDWLLNRFISLGDTIDPEDLRRVQDIVAHCKAMLADEATHDG